MDIFSSLSTDVGCIMLSMTEYVRCNLHHKIMLVFFNVRDNRNACRMDGIVNSAPYEI